MQVTNDFNYQRFNSGTKNTKEKSDSDLFGEMLRRSAKSIEETDSETQKGGFKEEDRKKLEEKGITVLEGVIAFGNYPPSTECKGLEALTPEVLADLKEKFDIDKLQPNSSEMQDFLYALKELDVISEKDYQDMVLGEPMTFDEKGMPTSWINYLGPVEGLGKSDPIGLGKAMVRESLIKWFQEMSSLCKSHYESIFRMGHGESSMEKMFQSKMNVTGKLSKILGKILED